jgi:hypothetical protein
MIDCDLFETHKGNKSYPLVAELNIINSRPSFVRDDFKLFLTPFIEDGVLHCDWVNQENDLDFNLLRAVFFINKVPMEEHTFTIPHNEDNESWWGHPYMDRLLNKLSIKFYGC